ncbi:PmoA family protein [Novipirellula rosea]|uniref:Methane oxygenase PmoA n=1 Tax=Novipirellula rosea TaxID=1031540 RepID=A0ABP8MT77_9BACT
MAPFVYSASPRCQIVPLPSSQVAFAIDGTERLRWHASADSPRPFFFPLTGPSGIPLTRMGHPGAPDHDHHRSVWFAHHKVAGNNFWADTTGTQIRQTQWMAYDDGDDEARMAVQLEWFGESNSQRLIKQDLFVAVAPAPSGGLFVELQTSLRSVDDTLELEQTKFGLLALRVAKAISVRFGDGVITGANGKRGEQELFGMASPWIDYSGSIDQGVVEGITYFDHPSNGRFPSKWHVRDDGWIGASVCRDGAVMLYKDKPTTWRYLLHAHAGAIDHDVAAQIQDAFHERPAMRLAKGGVSQAYTIDRV